VAMIFDRFQFDQRGITLAILQIGWNLNLIGFRFSTCSTTTNSTCVETPISESFSNAEDSILTTLRWVTMFVNYKAAIPP
jgi:hypothetical protein